MHFEFDFKSKVLGKLGNFNHKKTLHRVLLNFSGNRFLLTVEHRQ